MNGCELNAIREACGLSRDEMGNLLGVQNRTIKHWESGKTHLPDDVQTAANRLRELHLKMVSERLEQIERLRRLTDQASVLVSLVCYKTDSDASRFHEGTSHISASFLRAVSRAVAWQAPAFATVRLVWFDGPEFDAWAAHQARAAPQAMVAAWAAQHDDTPKHARGCGISDFEGL